MKTINAYIHQHAAETPDQLAVVTPTEQLTYAEFSARINERAAEFAANGLQADRPYVYRASQDAEFLITYYAVHQCNAVAITLDANLPQENFDRVKAEVEAYNFPTGIRTVLYTTGTTGRPKGVMLSEEAITTCAENFVQVMPFTEDLVFIVAGPVSHIASLYKIAPTLLVGGTVYVVNGLKNLGDFYGAFERFPDRKFASFLVPAHIRMLLQMSHDELTAVAGKVAFIETGAAPVTESDMRELSAVLTMSRLYNGYGATETAVFTRYDFNDGKYIVGCVGEPMPRAKVMLDIDGTVMVQAPTVMHGYINEPEKTAAVLTIDADGRRTFRTSDRGFFDEEGRLHLLGRNDNIINVGGFKADPVLIENTALNLDYLTECVVIPVPNPITGNSLKLLYVVKEGRECTSRDIAYYLRDRLEAYQVPALYERVDSINKLSNGKVDRRSYASK